MYSDFPDHSMSKSVKIAVISQTFLKLTYLKSQYLNNISQITVISQTSNVLGKLEEKIARVDFLG